MSSAGAGASLAGAGVLLLLLLRSRRQLGPAGRVLQAKSPHFHATRGKYKSTAPAYLTNANPEFPKQNFPDPPLDLRQ
jgi:hypothetical protein